VRGPRPQKHAHIQCHTTPSWRRSPEPGAAHLPPSEHADADVDILAHARAQRRQTLQVSCLRSRHTGHGSQINDDAYVVHRALKIGVPYVRAACCYVRTQVWRLEWAILICRPAQSEAGRHGTRARGGGGVVTRVRGQTNDDVVEFVTAQPARDRKGIRHTPPGTRYI
jgi:hypothetical protein